MRLMRTLFRTVLVFGLGVTIGYAVTKAWAESAPG
jgi:hypothetical protein